METLKKCTPESIQAIQTRRYLEWFEKVPWQAEEVKYKDIKDTKRILDEDHFGMNDVKQIIMEVLAVQALKEEHSGLVLLLSGPPGVGKTSFARSIARALDKPFRKISMGGMTDSVAIKGCDRVYSNAFPGAIMRALCECGTSAPVLLLDEVDKITKESNKGDCASILLDILDSNRTTFVDQFLQVPFDLSRVIFICTANEVDNIPKPLKDRMEHIKIRGYTQEEKFQIAKRYIIPKKLQETGLLRFDYSFSEEAVQNFVDYCCHQEGVRKLEKLVTAACRRVALLHLNQELNSSVISKAFLEEQKILPLIEVRKEKKIGFYSEELVI